MGERSDAIERYIEQKRGELGDNLTELEDRVKRAVDWREQMNEHPMGAVALAFAGGVFLSVILKGPSRRPAELLQEDWGEAPSPPGPSYQRPRSHQKAQAWSAWENIKDALFGVTAGKVVTFLDRTIPGFQDEFQKAGRRRPAWPSFESAQSSYGTGPVEHTKPY
jgi:hypothetical protein